MTHANSSRNVVETTNKIKANQTIEDINNNKNNNFEEFKETDEFKSNITSLKNNSESTINNNSEVIDEKVKALHNNKTDIKVENPNLLKYVHKKNEKVNISEKTTGSSKNKLKRKRRSSNLDNIHDIHKSPPVTHFETPIPTLGGTLQRDGEIWLLARNTANVIKNSDLADFNIETLHENNNKQSNINEPSQNTQANLDSSENDNDSSDRENYTNSKDKINKESEESNENENESSENGHYKQNSSEEYTGPSKIYENKNSRNVDGPNVSSERDSNEDNNSREHNTSNYSKSKNIDESVENYSGEIKKDRYDDLETKRESLEDSDTRYKPEEKSLYRGAYENNSSNLDKIIDVDPGDYEKIIVNKKGEVETAKDTFNNRESDSSVEVISTKGPSYSGNQLNNKISILPRESLSSSSESVEHSEPTHINDGEVKPVVEINAESDSNEASDETSDELKAKLENESLETLTGVNEQESVETNGKIQDPRNQDVKQQFERIPLNYNHCATQQNKNLTEENANSTPENNVQNNDEGTLDQLKPRYDEQLNIKFDDIHIKLPEIKLPDDILSYAYEEPPVYNNKDEQVEKPSYYQAPAFYQQKDKNEEAPRFYHYSDEIRDESGDESEDKGYDNDNKNHYGYYGSNKKNNAYKQKENDDKNDYGYYGSNKKNDAYKQKENNEQEDDLYEKFVREKFGKRGTFKNRLEKLTVDKTYNPILNQKVQNILKKTEDVRNQAAKSGDPNAGYMWTLEYGEQL